MRDAYLRLLSTPAVLAEQERTYGRARLPAASDFVQPLGPEERAFIAARDSFYLATISDHGWPYVQHRGGPPGFLQVLDERHLAFADFPGNRQLISTAHVRTMGRVALFLMDYVARERLKVIGHAEVLDGPATEAFRSTLPSPPGGRIERVFRIEVVGFDWNCPKYITPRYTVDQVDAVVAPLRARIAELESERDQLLATVRQTRPMPSSVSNISIPS